jgi:hypothetical protein
MDKITRGVKSMLRRSSVKVREMRKRGLREFYMYRYERWNLFKGWLDDSPKYSDE